MTLTPDRAVALLASRQHGVVAHFQCRQLGLSTKQVLWRVDSGHWRRIHRGVYAIGVSASAAPGRYLAATFGGGPGAVLSHRSAAAAWSLLPHESGPVHVTSANKRSPRGSIALHWTRHFEPGMRTVRSGVPSTTLARTLIDLAEVADRTEVETAVRAAERIHNFDRTLLVPIRGRRGTGRLRPPAAYQRGHLERRLRRLLRGQRMLSPAYNVPWGAPSGCRG